MAASELVVAPFEKIEPAFLYVAAEAGSKVSEEELNGIRGFQTVLGKTLLIVNLHRLVRQRACPIKTWTVRLMVQSARRESSLKGCRFQHKRIQERGTLRSP